MTPEEKTAYLRKILRWEISEWSFPASQWEADLVKELSEMPVYAVFRMEEEQMQELGMKPNHCHENCLRLEAEDPTQQIKRITGWWPSEGKFLSHSVVQANNELVCVTPIVYAPYTPIPFVPDTAIEVRYHPGDNCDYLYRNGRMIGTGVRHDPERTIKECDWVREQLDAGRDPVDIVTSAMFSEALVDPFRDMSRVVPEVIGNG